MPPPSRANTLMRLAPRARPTRLLIEIVFFETLFDLAHEVCADISGFGVNAAAKSREHADETSPEGETNQTIDRDRLLRDPVRSCPRGLRRHQRLWCKCRRQVARTR